MAMNFIAQSMRRFGLAPNNKVEPSSASPNESKSPGNDPLGHMKIGSKWSYSTLEYPIDIQARSDLGHYMLFYINVPTDSPSGRKQRKDDLKKAGLSTPKNMDPRQSITNVSNKLPKLDTAAKALLHQGGFSERAAGPTGISAYDEDGNTWMPGKEPTVIGRRANQGEAAKLLGGRRTTRTSDAIVLYMPPQINVNYNSQYKESELGAIGATGSAGGAVLGALGNSPSQALTAGADGSSIRKTAEVIGEEIVRTGQAAIGTGLRSDIKGAEDKLSNRAQNNFMEVMFTGIGHRKFSYTWKFAPKNADESTAAWNIINKFKFHMAPEYSNDPKFGRFFVVPSEFDVFYMFRGEENEWLNKISTCVLVNMDVNYTPNQYQTFRPHKNRKGAPPTEIDMKLDFMETEIITKRKINQGF